jgi:hypothetical protein
VAVDPDRVYAMAYAFAKSVKDWCEKEAPAEWDGGSLGYDVGGLHAQATELLAAIDGLPLDLVERPE